MKGLPVPGRFHQIMSIIFAACLFIGVFQSPTAARAEVSAAATDRSKPKTKKSKRNRPKKKANMKAIPPDEAAEEAALADLGEGHSLHRTRHYSVLYDTSEQDVKAFSTAIEKTYVHA